ncbi:MAG: ClpXP protease specificity-enhancing factor [Betaproteobacteria bacterium]|nr:ClpXP protease specificity-enhancing factor [Betaproteobacteria bacterium]
MKERSTRPYLIRAIYEWCVDSGMTPFISVRVDQRTRVPMEFVKGGEIVLNVSADATRNLTLGNDLIQFSARFGGVSRELSVPVSAVAAIFAKENGQGLFFPQEETEAAGEAQAAVPAADSGETPPSTPGGGKPKLQVIK